MENHPEAAATPAALKDPMVPALARVEQRFDNAPDTITLELVLTDNQWQGFTPGQFTMLSAFGVGEVPISISGDPDDNSKIVHTIRAVGAVSRALCSLQPGDIVGLRGPYGKGWPIEQAHKRDVLVIAGGLGLAPVRPVLYHLMKNRQDFGTVALLYGTRSSDDILFPDELQQWGGRLDMDVLVTVDHGDDNWRGHVGLVTRLIPKADFMIDNCLAMICGPEVMMRFSARALIDMGVPGRDVYLSLERNMKCGIGLCGHCQIGPAFVCKDGPVMPYDELRPLLAIKEL
jgi:NAD(P)H-flavin reductase